MIAGFKGYVTVGLYEDGAPGELFVSMAKQGSTLSGMLDAWAIGISLALQFGVPVEHIIRKFKGMQFEPSGITTTEEIRFAGSVVDYIARWLELKFVQDGAPEGAAAEAQKPQERTEGPESWDDPRQLASALLEASEKVSAAYSLCPAESCSSVTVIETGPPCAVCGSMTVPSGKCHRCPSCGSTTGCS
jgi:ribonucleoside-diphosphate reductase alpha chain